MAIDLGGRMKGQSQLLYRSKAAMCQMSYAGALEDDGTFGERARRQWENAEREWNEFGKVDIPASEVKGGKIQLGDLEARREKVQDIVKQLDALQSGVRENIHQEKLAKLTDEQRKAREIPFSERNEEQLALAADAERMLKIRPEEIARRITGPKRLKATELARTAGEHLRVIQEIRTSRQVVNFAYWRLRAQVEQLDDTLEARKLIYEGNQEFFVKGGLNLLEARLKYEKGLAAWRRVLDNDKFPQLLTDETVGRDLMELIGDYRKILDACDKSFPENFILQDVIDLHGPQR